MNVFSFLYNGSSRDLRKVIIAILRSGTANQIYKINYGQGFQLKEKDIKKSEIKLLIMATDDEERLIDFLSKNFPQIERLNIV